MGLSFENLVLLILIWQLTSLFASFVRMLMRARENRAEPSPVAQIAALMDKYIAFANEQRQQDRADEAVRMGALLSPLPNASFDGDELAELAGAGASQKS